MKLTLKLALIVLVTAAGSASQGFTFFGKTKAKSFQIEPYVFMDHGERVSVGWQYAKGRPQKMALNVPLCGLNSVSYQVDGMPMPKHVQSLPCPCSGQPVRFAFLADTQEGVDKDATFARLIRKFNNMAVIYGGDLVQNGEVDSQWEDFFAATKVLNSETLMIPVVGNHEYRSDNNADGWNRYFGVEARDAHYSVWIGDVHVMVLNSNFSSDPHLVYGQLPWLESELIQKARWKVVVFHHPPYSKSIMHQILYPKKEYVHIQEDYVPLFEKYNVDVVLNGHTHIYEHSLKNGIHYITTGAAGGKMGHLGGTNPFELQMVETRSAIQFEVSQDIFRSTAYTIDGKTLDDILIRKSR